MSHNFPAPSAQATACVGHLSRILLKPRGEHKSRHGPSSSRSQRGAAYLPSPTRLSGKISPHPGDWSPSPPAPDGALLCTERAPGPLAGCSEALSPSMLEFHVPLKYDSPDNRNWVSYFLSSAPRSRSSWSVCIEPPPWATGGLWFMAPLGLVFFPPAVPPSLVFLLLRLGPC